MGISNEKYHSLLASGCATVVREDRIAFPSMLPADRSDSEAGDNGIRIKEIGCLELSNNSLVLIIKHDQIIGTAILSEDQLGFLSSSWFKDFENYQVLKDQ